MRYGRRLDLGAGADIGIPRRDRVEGGGGFADGRGAADPRGKRAQPPHCVSMLFVPAERPPSPLLDPVRLVAPERAGPFVPGRETALAKVAGRGLEALEIHDGDHVVLVRRDVAEHGDLAAVLDDRGQATLWKVYPEGDAMRLSTGRPGADRRVQPAPRIQGVVVAVLRRFPI